MKKVLSTFSNKREVSIHEAVKRVLSQWLFKKSRTVINVSNHPGEERHRMPKSNSLLAEKETMMKIFGWPVCMISMLQDQIKWKMCVWLHLLHSTLHVLEIIRMPFFGEERFGMCHKT